MYVFAAAVGLYTGGPNSIMTPISLKMVGMEYLSSAHGLERFFCGLGYFSGPPVAGLLIMLHQVNKSVKFTPTYIEKSGIYFIDMFS